MKVESPGSFSALLGPNSFDSPVRLAGSWPRVRIAIVNAAPAGKSQFKRKLSIGVSSARADPKSARLCLGEGFLGVQDAKVFSNEVSLFVILTF
jgi:hypothetical protein